MANSYKLKIVRGDQQFEAEGDKAFVLGMAERFQQELSSTHGQKGTRRGASRPGSVSEDATSVREFIQQLGFKKHTDIVLGFGYFLAHSLAKARFTPADVNHLYYEAKFEPSNTSQAIIQNVKRGMMIETQNGGSERKGYTLTQSGESYVANSLEKASA